MSASKHIDKICIAGAVLLLLSVVLLWHGASLGLARASAAPAYASGLFDRSRVHTVDIVMDDWEGFLEGCADEAYVPCAVVIDGEAYRNVGFRVKGNTSLTAVESMGSSRYSFKIEFDHYVLGKNCQGLDKLCLNNIVQDNTYLKDYLCYTMMADAGVAAPLCSFAFLTVNGEDWGLYLAVEGVEEAFLRRNFGEDSGALYKPNTERRCQRLKGAAVPPAEGGAFPNGGRPLAGVPAAPPAGSGGRDMCLQYVGAEVSDYPNIFDHAKTDVTPADQRRLIGALEKLSSGQAAEAVDVEQVIRYFAVHSFVCNDDSYTGVMAHNYYLYEAEGRLAMIPWDYNLAFGGFGMTDAGVAVNAPIDTPVVGVAMEERPMVSWIFEDEAYRVRYHEVYGAFLQRWFAEGRFHETVAQAVELIGPYVERDPTKFCTFAQFEAGVAALKAFCRLRGESVDGQLAGRVPSTAAAQAKDPGLLVDAGELDLRDMGGMEQAAGAAPGNLPPPAGVQEGR